MKKQPVLTLTIIVICTMIYMLSHLVGLDNTTEAAIFLGAYYKPFILAGQWWRLLTAGFVHTNLIHLSMNCLAIYSIGTFLEQHISKIRYILVLFCSIIAGTMLQFATNENTVLVGISGGIYGLLATELVLLYEAGAFHNPQLRFSVMRVLFINLAISLVPGVSLRAHVGGFLAGLGIAGIQPHKGYFKWLYAGTVVLYFCLLMFADLHYTTIPEEQRYIGSDIHVLETYERYGLHRTATRIAGRLPEIYQLKQ